MAWIVADLRVQASAIDVVRGVLDDHDRVVNHDADRQDQAEHGEHVDRKAERRHGRESTDDGHGNGRRGNEHGPPVLEKQKNDHQDQQPGLEQRLVDFADRLIDENRRVEGDRVLQALGERGLERLERLLDPACDGQGVGAGS